MVLSTDSDRKDEGAEDQREGDPANFRVQVALGPRRFGGAGIAVEGIEEPAVVDIGGGEEVRDEVPNAFDLFGRQDQPDGCRTSRQGTLIVEDDA